MQLKPCYAGSSIYKISVLYNGVNTEIKCRKNFLEREHLSVFRVGFIGRLDTPKGVHVLIDAIRILSDNNIDLFVAGDGVLRSALKDQTLKMYIL